MNQKLIAIFKLLTLSFILGMHPAVAQYAPFDELPGFVKSIKPAYDPGYPEWAKKLYDDEINFYEVNKLYETFMAANPGKKSAITRYYKSWRRAVREYVLPDGSIQLPEMDNYHRELHESRKNQQYPWVSRESDSEWSFLGPKETFWLNENGTSEAPDRAPWQVNVYAIDVAPSDFNVIYAGTETGFVNKSTDKGQTWQLMAPGYLFGGGITAVAVHPADPNIVFVSGGNQVHRSDDGGLSWQPMLPLNNLFYADRLRIDPQNPLKIFAASEKGIFVSSDGGNTWTQRYQNQAWDIRIKPGDGQTIYAITRNAGFYSLVRSLNGGQSFSIVQEFPGNYSVSSGAYLGVTAKNPELLFSVLLGSNDTPYLLKGNFANNNISWNLIATGRTANFEMDNGQGYFDLAMEISPLDEKIILVGTTTLFKSTNGGLTFSAVGGYWGPFNIHPDIQDIKMLPNGETWVATDGGMNYTSDVFTIQDNYHVRCKGLMGSDMWGFDQGWNEDLVVGGRYHNGNTAIADFYQNKSLRMGGAESPTGWVLQGRSRHVAFDDLGNGWILPKTAESEPEGRFIFSKYPNMDEYGGRRSNFVHHPNYYGTFYLGEGNGFWKSTDMGVSYNLLHTFPGRVRYLQISYKNPDVIYADVNNYGLYRSGDGGHTWVQKPALTSAPYGHSGWKGNLFFAISPYDENTIYACLQNGTWSADIGKVFQSQDGGNTWEDWSGTVSDYLKCLVIQPTAGNEDLVYLFTKGLNGKPARVMIRKQSMADWVDFSSDYPVGMAPNMALPFFRDSKIRVGGNGSVWESPLAEPEFIPVINPWVEKPFYSCMTDTLYFDDHSMINHEGASWHWEIDPEPEYISDPNIRNPKVVLGNPGSYTVHFSVMQKGETYSKTIQDMVSATTCPSIEDCSNPADVPKDNWSLLNVDSQETTGEDGKAINAIDGDPSTIWHTEWYWNSPGYPHEISIDLGDVYRISEFTYLPRQDGENGRIKNYKLYISKQNNQWGLTAATGNFLNTAAPQKVPLDPPVAGRYLKLVAVSEVNGNPWASAAELSVKGCLNIYSSLEQPEKIQALKAFPVPSTGKIRIAAPSGKAFSYQVHDMQGKIVLQGLVDDASELLELDLSIQLPGVYLVTFTSQGVHYYAKVVKM